MERFIKIPLSVLGVCMDKSGIFPSNITILQGRTPTQDLIIETQVISTNTEVDPKGKRPTKYIYNLKTKFGTLVLEGIEKTTEDQKNIFWKSLLLIKK